MSRSEILVPARKDCERHRLVQVSFEAVPKFPNSRHSLEILEDRYEYACACCGARSVLITAPVQPAEIVEP
jgi:hypothetical protein